MMVRQVFPQPGGLSPLLTQEFRPHPVADAMNPLLRLKINPPAFPQELYPATEQAGPTVARAALADTPLPPVRPPDLSLSGLSPDAGAAAPAAPAAPAGSSAPPLSDFSSILRNTVGGSGGPQQMYSALNLGGAGGGGLGAMLAQAINPAAVSGLPQSVIRNPPIPPRRPMGA